MAFKPKIDILMVNYNHGERIGKSIESVLNQTYPEFRLLIIDDGSTDDSCSVIREYADRDARIAFYPQEKNRHICHATNTGLHLLEGDYLARIDSDDIWYEEKLKEQVEFFASHPESKVCFAWVDILDEYDRLANDRDPELFYLLQAENRKRTDWLKRFFHYGNCLCQSSVMIERSVVEETGDYNPAYRQLSDFDYWVRIARRHQLYVMPKRLAALRRFFDGGKVNTSSYAREDRVRMFYEHLLIQRDMLDHLDDGTFIETFAEEFQDPSSRTPQELKCEKAFLLLYGSFDGAPSPIYGMQMMEELLRDQETCRILEEKYHFTAKDFYQWTGKSCMVDQWVARERQELEEELRKAGLSLQEKQRELDEILGSKVWKLASALRSFRHRLKP